MTDAEVLEVAKALKLSHRINNPVALFKLCDEAASMLEQFIEDRQKPRRKPRISAEN